MPPPRRTLSRRAWPRTSPNATTWSVKPRGRERREADPERRNPRNGGTTAQGCAELSWARAVLVPASGRRATRLLSASGSLANGSRRRHLVHWWRDTVLAIAGAMLIVLAIWLSLQLPLPW